jgi:isoleucyl-tRNA synthetase
VLSRIKARPQTYPAIDIAYSSTEPLQEPVILSLPKNGLRLRFDGPDQRLRLIEVLDFSKVPLVYKNHEVVKHTKPHEQPSSAGPSFRHVYNRLFGPSYPGEYIPPTDDSVYGTYVLSYPGVAFSFPLQNSAWSDNCDFVALLSSSAASSATSMAVFQGASWSEARYQLFTIPPQLPRSPALIGKGRDAVPDEIEEIQVLGGGKIELSRRASPPLIITLSETTPQDLIAELGPPDAIYRKNDSRISIHGARGVNQPRPLSPSPGRRLDTLDTDQSSNNSPAEDSDDEAFPGTNFDPSSLSAECFFNYFHHGFDAFISHPTSSGPAFPGSGLSDRPPPNTPSLLTVTKLIVHGNVPGSYPFNRYRRSRWRILIGDSADDDITSETHFEEISQRLRKVWRASYSSASEETALQRGMVLNRGWGDSPESSVEFLGGWEESAGGKHRSTSAGPDGGQGLGNTELFGFPGLLFEVLKNGAVSSMTIY